MKKGAQKTDGKSSVRPSHAPDSPVRKPREANFLTNLLRVLALFAVVGITLYIFSIRDRVQDFAAYGYPGIFVIAMLANATILLPAPGVAVIYAALAAVFIEGCQ